MTDYLGLNWNGQRRRVQRDPVLNQEIKGVVVMTTPSADGRGGGPQEITCLPLKYIPGFLFGISADRVNPELRDKIIRYQKECYEVLAEAFKEGRLSGDPSFGELLRMDTPAVQAYRAALAIVEIARQQVILEAKLTDHEQRLEALEATMGNTGRFINKEQAMHLSQSVKTLALALGKKSGPNKFQGVYGELYRRFRLPSYRELPASQFDQAMRFLREWYASNIDAGDVPF